MKVEVAVLVSVDVKQHFNKNQLLRVCHRAVGLGERGSKTVGLTALVQNTGAV